jgi:hypothetical protein
MTFETILNGFVAFAVGMAGAYLGAYLKKRGDSEAEKEMIGAVTREIEQVRIEFNGKLEGLKSELVFTNTFVLNKSSDERQAIYKLIDAYYPFLHNAMLLIHTDYTEKGFMNSFSGTIH